MLGMKAAIKRLLRGAGFDLRRRTVQVCADVQLGKILRHCEIDLVLDVGANSGHYGRALRELGYGGRIVSFEPLAAAHEELLGAARRSASWTVAPRMALGEAEGEIELQVAGNSVSSSILDMLPAHEKAAPGSAYVAREKVALRRLDGVAGQYLADARRVLLKIDTQGYEHHVLAGATGMLERITAIQTELTLVPLYAGQRLIDEMRARIEGMGFELFAVFPGYVDERSGRTLQVDGFFVRRGSAD